MLKMDNSINTGSPFLVWSMHLHRVVKAVWWCSPDSSWPVPVSGRERERERETLSVYVCVCVCIHVHSQLLYKLYISILHCV